MLARAQVAVGFFLLLAAPVCAEDPQALLPPGDLHGSYDEATHLLALTWTPPGEGAYTYHVYRDGTEIGTTTATGYTDTYALNPDTGLGAVYTVRASLEGSGVQSAPSAPFIPGSNAQPPSPIDDAVERVEGLLEPGPLVQGLLNGRREPCDVINLGIPNPNVDVNCILDWIRP